MLGADGSRWIRTTNIRQIKYSIRKQLPRGDDVPVLAHAEQWDLNQYPELYKSLSKSLWSYKDISQVAVETVGRHYATGAIELKDIADVVRGILSARDIMIENEQYRRLLPSTEAEDAEETEAVDESSKNVDEILKKVKEGDNVYEKALIDSVIRPSKSGTILTHRIS